MTRSPKGKSFVEHPGAQHCRVIPQLPGQWQSGVQSDPSIDRPEKNKPVQSHEERIGIVSSLKFVDEVVTYDTEADLIEVLKNMNPDLRILGAEHEGKPFTGHELPIKGIFNTRDHGYSTSELRRRVFEAEKSKT